uniref:Cuticle protein 6 n=1 Tax=Lygus hesperus TaxID=30085 RepID=A0A0A9XMS1_LYGHE
MKYVILLSVIACASCNPLIAGIVANQYHAQDVLGQYTYGYSGGPSAKQEVKTADGITRGSYSYIEETVSYRALLTLLTPSTGSESTPPTCPWDLMGPSLPLPSPGSSALWPSAL